MNTVLIDRIIGILAPEGFDARAESEVRYSRRNLPADAEVMRVPPSPTGFVHIGTIYAGLVNERIAHQTGGVFILRIEDTDKKREVEGSLLGIVSAFKEFDLRYDEGPERDGVYGPYQQSMRGKTYLGYAVELLKSGWAYPCFAAAEDLAENVQTQQKAKVRPGYYGDWALWRDRSDADILAAMDAGLPFVLRFRSRGSHDKRVQYEDIFKGHMDVPENDLDVPLIKSDEYRLPTYHLAHIVDDYLMGTTKVFRSDEWLPSTALHIELAQALGITPFTYGHFAPISIIDKVSGGKRKLSKRKDDEADVQYWLQAGYPIEGVKAYLLGLANSNFEDWYLANPGKPLTDYKVSIEKLAASRSPLLDMNKLDDVCKNLIASFSQDEFEAQILAHNDLLAKESAKDPEYVHKVFEIERSGDKPRKDIAKWSQAHDQYGYFFDEIFASDFIPLIAEQLQDFDAETVEKACTEFVKTYDPNDESDVWFAKLKGAAVVCGFATDNKDFKTNPDKYRGNVADFARIIRVKLTGKNRTPDLCTIMKSMGNSRIQSRLQ